MDAAQLLRSVLDKNEPQLIQTLMNVWRAQGKAITYKEIRQMIIDGTVPMEYFKEWQQDYAKMVADHFAPRYRAVFIAAATQAMHQANAALDYGALGLQEFIETKGAQLVVQITTTQQEALQALITNAAGNGELTVDQLSRFIRPCVGLYPQQALAVERYRNTLLKAGRSVADTQRLTFNYAGRLHRYRAMMIARTEMAFAYNAGNDAAMTEAKNLGLIKGYKKQWVTADDERTCETCGPLDGVTVGQDDMFTASNGKKVYLPPLHPHCRCAVANVIEE